MRAQPPVRLVRVPAAPGTIAPRNALVDALAGAAVFGPAGLGIPDALDARRPALAGSLPIGGTAFLETGSALHAPRFGPAVATSRTEPLRTALFGAPPMALALMGALLLGVAERHRGRLPGR
ncbi:MAG: hypothetical protein OXQ89_17240 [Rhodospirillaceae bacterium]|nr:hypothetical protein [Rhodospirillaceae bacterium]